MNLDQRIAGTIRNGHVPSYSLGSREETANQIVEIINDSTSPKLRELRHEGIVKMPSLGSSNVETIQNFLKGESVYNGHRTKYSDGVARPLTADYPFAFGSYALASVMRCPHLLEFALHPVFLSTAKEYLGCIPTMYSFHAWWSIAGYPAPMTQVIHRDYDDFKFISLILYLTDVNENNGPHIFYPGTHRKEGMEGVNPLTITGPAGTSFMADTYAFHQGKPLQSGRRLAFWARYGLYKNWIYDHDAAGTVPRSVVNDRIQWTEELRYITRLLFTED